MAYTLLSSPLFVETILPFLLVFTLVFAVLQKTEVLGKGKKQIDAIVALVIGLIVVSFGYATGVIVSIIPFLAVGAVVILVFMLLYGMVFKAGEFKLHWGVQTTIGILAAIGVIIATLIATGAWDYLTELFNTSSSSSSVITNLIFIGVAAVAIAVVLLAGKDSGSSSK